MLTIIDLTMKIMIKKRFTRAAVVALLSCGFCATATTASAASSDDIKRVNQYRFNFEMEWPLAKGLKLSVAPEMRRDDSFALNQFQIEAALQYKTFGFLYWGAKYRLTVLPSEEEYGVPTTSGLYHLSATVKESFGKFTPSLRVLYSNDFSEDTTQAYMRYRAMVKYDIRKCPITPFIAVEAFHGLDEDLLQRMRYSTGIDYKVKKGRYLCLDYKFDFYTLEYKNRNIFNIGYKINF